MNLLAFLPNVHYVHSYYKWNLIANDPDDNKYCDAAVSGHADYIVTEDKHFNALKHIKYPKLVVKTIEEFIELL